MEAPRNWSKEDEVYYWEGIEVSHPKTFIIVKPYEGPINVVCKYCGKDFLFNCDCIGGAL